VIDLSRKETKLIFNHLCGFLKYFETESQEYRFWNKTYKLKELKEIKEKLKHILEKNA
tara:strand:- start:910 stop:1083 length:174 start_codon:yes stop_codon:yes gene_type:complete